MKLIRMRDLVDGEAYPNRKRLIALMDGRKTNEVYMCGSCGKLEFSGLSEPTYKPFARSREVAQTPITKFKRISQLEQILIEQADLTIAPDINTLLKLKPGKSGLQEVISKIRYPIKKKLIKTGILLSFKSHTVERPHRFLIEPIHEDIKLIAIHNDGNAFDLSNLSAAYGRFKYAQRIEDYRFWFFDQVGVAFATPVKDDEEIVYVQFFEGRISFERYIELQCFFEETFI